MKITPLFQNQQEFNEEEMLLYLDLPDDDPQKRAFLNQIVLHPDLWSRWEGVLRLMEAGGDLNQYDPPPGVRARVMDLAYAERFSHKTAPLPEPKRFSLSWNLPGWKLAWAALFLVICWGGSMQFEGSANQVKSMDQLDYELLTLEQALQDLQSDIYPDETT